MNGIEGIRAINAWAAECAAKKNSPAAKAKERKIAKSFTNASKPVRNRTVTLQGREVTV